MSILNRDDAGDASFMHWKPVGPTSILRWVWRLFSWDIHRREEIVASNKLQHLDVLSIQPLLRTLTKASGTTEAKAIAYWPRRRVKLGQLDLLIRSWKTEILQTYWPMSSGSFQPAFTGLTTAHRAELPFSQRLRVHVVQQINICVLRQPRQCLEEKGDGEGGDLGQ